MTPILFASTETAFTSNGIGALSDAVSCKIQQDLNGMYELTMRYPLSGIRYADMELRAIILAKPDKISDAQPFRIYRMTKPINGIVTVYARHLAYDLMGIPVEPFNASEITGALNGLRTHAAVTCPFTFQTDKTVASPFAVTAPASIWSCLGGTQGGILDTYGGEYEFDGYTVHLWNRRGSNRGAVVSYGKNMTDFEQDSNCANVWTGVYPYWQSFDGETLVQLPEKVINASGTYDFTRILPLDCGEYFKDAPTESALRTRAQQYMTDNDIGVPSVSWKVDFIMLSQTEEYKNIALLEDVFLGDTVTVRFPEMGVNASARAVEIVYDTLLERYDSVTLGSVRANFAQSIVDQKKEIAEKPSKTLTEQIVDSLTSSIIGANGGAVRMLDTNGDGEPDTLYIADNPDPAQAVKVWRFNYEGWAASSSGYNGPFTMGATLDDGLLADFVTAANLTAGTITSRDGTTFRLNLDTGLLQINGDNGGVELVNAPIHLEVQKIFSSNDYTQTDVDTCRDIILGLITPTPAQVEKYDINGDGVITNSDLILIRNITLYGTLTITCTIDLRPTLNESPFEIHYAKEYATPGQGVSRTPIKVTTDETIINDLTASVDGYAVQGVESGRSGDWTWRKYSDGTAECWGVFSRTVTSWSAWGSLYEGTSFYLNYPITFSSEPIVEAWGAGGGVGLCGVEVYGTGSESQTPTIYPLRPNAVTVPATVKIGIRAVGRAN